MLMKKLCLPIPPLSVDLNDASLLIHKKKIGRIGTHQCCLYVYNMMGMDMMATYVTDCRLGKLSISIELCSKSAGSPLLSYAEIFQPPACKFCLNQITKLNHLVTKPKYSHFVVMTIMKIYWLLREYMEGTICKCAVFISFESSGCKNRVEKLILRRLSCLD